MVESDADSAHGKLAFAFAQALVAGDFQSAHSMLCDGFRSAATPERIRKNYEEMVAYGDGPPTEVSLPCTMTEWPGKRRHDLGWAYVSIGGLDFIEAVTVIVCEEQGRPVIRELEWGRP